MRALIRGMLASCDLFVYHVIPRGKIDTQTLTSQSVDVAANRYAVAVLKDGK